MKTLGDHAMLNATSVGVLLGFAIFLVGVHGFRYMQARIYGGWIRVQGPFNFFGKYRALIREGKAPLWPLILYGVCSPLGIIVAFASILLTKTVP